MNEEIGKIYYNASHPAGYGSYTTLRKYLPRKISNENIKSFLQSQDAYTLHAPARRTFKRDCVFSTNIDDYWHIDLADMTKYKLENNGFCFIFVAIDVLSKFAFAKCLKNKTALSVKNALGDIFQEQNRKPLKIYSDKGLEIKNRTVISFLKENDIEIYFAENSDTKACCAERFLRTIKTRLWRYFTYKGNHRYVDILPEIIESYNNTFHRSIGTSPSSVTEDNFLNVWRKLYKTTLPLKGTKQKFAIGDCVRLNKLKRHFAKGFENNYTDEIFQVTKVFLKRPIMYQVADLEGEIIKGRFYEMELQKINRPDVYKIDKILDTRGKGDTKELYVKWTSYPDKFNSWILAKDLKQNV